MKRGECAEAEWSGCHFPVTFSSRLARARTQGPAGVRAHQSSLASPGSRTLSTNLEKLDNSRETERWSVGGGWGRAGVDILEVDGDIFKQKSYTLIYVTVP